MSRSGIARLDVRQHAALFAGGDPRCRAARAAFALPFRPADGPRGAVRGDRLRRRAPLHDVVRAARRRSRLRQFRLVPERFDRRPAGGAEPLRRGRDARTGHLLPRYDDLHCGRHFADSGASEGGYSRHDRRHGLSRRIARTDRPPAAGSRGSLRKVHRLYRCRDRRAVGRTRGVGSHEASVGGERIAESGEDLHRAPLRAQGQPRHFEILFRPAEREGILQHLPLCAGCAAYSPPRRCAFSARLAASRGTFPKGSTSCSG